VITDARHQGDGYYDFYGTPSPPLTQTAGV
jgi:hypothetical protein